MNTNPPSEGNDQPEKQEDEGEALTQLLEELDNINENSEDAPLNKYSINDNKGGRIELMKRHTQSSKPFYS